MKHPIKLFLPILLFSLLINGFFIGESIAQNKGTVEDAILAVVNDEVITLKDLKDYLRITSAGMIAAGVPKSEIQNRMVFLEKNGLQKLIEDKLILSEANRLDLKVDETAVDKKIEEIISGYPSEPAFMKALIEYGSTMSDLREKILNQLKIQFVIEHFVKSKVKVSPKEVTDYYKKNSDKFRKKAQADLDSIYIPIEGNKLEAQTKAQEALDLLKKGESFNSVAKKYSSTASIGIIEKGQVLPAIEKTVFNLKQGQFSPIVEIETGFYIFKLKKLIPSKTASLEEVKQQITQRLYSQKHDEKLIEWINKLKEKSYVDIKK